MFLSGVGTEHLAPVFEPASNRTESIVQKADKHDDNERKVQAASAAVQDRVTLSREAQHQAQTSRQNAKAGQGTPQDSRSPFDR